MRKAQHRRYWEGFEDHTLFKHLVLECYAHAWMQKVSRGRPGINNLLVVDAFAGLGADKRGNPGSPVRLARAAAIAGARLAEDFGRPIPVHVIAIELEADWCARLREYMAPFGESVQVLEGTLSQHLTPILARFETAPMLFFLDPFGVKGLDASLVAHALAGEARELLVLFNDPGADRLAGAAGGYAKPPTDELVLSLFGPEAAAEPTAGESEDARPEPNWAEGGASREILDRAFGGDRWERALSGAMDAERRRKALIGEYEAMLHEMGLAYTTRIPVRNTSGPREYTLMHASRSPHGRLTMKEEVVRALNASQLPDRVKDITRQELRTDLTIVEQLLWEHFNRQEVYWSDAYKRSLREFILTETGVFPHQLEELKSRLRNLKVPGSGPHRYSFIR